MIQVIKSVNYALEVKYQILLELVNALLIYFGQETVVSSVIFLDISTYSLNNA
jgi:hypothetical protein